MPDVLKGGLQHAGDGNGMLSEIFGCKITAVMHTKQYCVRNFHVKWCRIREGCTNFTLFGICVCQNFAHRDGECVMRGKVENGLEMTVFHLVVCVIPNKSVTFAIGMAFMSSSLL